MIVTANFFHFRIPVSNFIARKNRDSIIKLMYIRMFDLLLSTINQEMRLKTQSELSTSIIDIAGFGKHKFVSHII